MNTVTVNFVPCSPAPANGYNLKWRVAGTNDPYTDEGNFTTPPAVFTDAINPPGTQYEGFLQSDCGDGLMGNPVPWTSQQESSPVTANCYEHVFQVFGSDGESVHITGINCDGTPYEHIGFVGDGAPPPQCLQAGTVNTHASFVIVTNDTDPCGPCVNYEIQPVGGALSVEWEDCNGGYLSGTYFNAQGFPVTVAIVCAKYGTMTITAGNGYVNMNGTC